MTCEVCGEPTSADRSDEPADGAGLYTTLVVEDYETPDGALNLSIYEFCSPDHLALFAEGIEAE